MTVKITINVTDGVVQEPPRANANRIDQDVTWIINNPPGSGITFEDPPIVFANPAPKNYDSWPGTPVTKDPRTPNQWNASVNKRLDPGSNPEVYKYDIVWTTGSLDPDLGNEPVPPDDRDEDKDKDKDKP